MTALAQGVRDGGIIAWRNLLNVRRNVDWLFAAVIQPIMFVLLFAYVFGGALGGGAYREFLIAGIFVQTTAFNSAFTVIGLCNDLQKGIIDRFRSLPMSQSAVLAGRTASDVVYNVLSLVIMALTGLLVGWRVHGTVLEAAAAFGLLLVFAYAVSWIMALVGVLVPSVEVINNASFIVIMPLTFVSNAFVPIESFPTALQYFAEWNPVSAVTQATRELFGNTNPAAPVSDAWSMQHPAAYTLIWVVGILLVFVPLSVRQFKRTSK